MDSNRLDGLPRDLAGRFQGVIGGLTGGAATRACGRANRAAGEIQHAYGEVFHVVERAASSRPLLTVAAAARAGFVPGIPVARR